MIHVIPFLCVGFLTMSSILHSLSHAQSSEPSHCVITERSCPCSQSDPSGTCLRYQGDGKCLLGVCQQAYKCDCLGYQMCTRSSCAVYTSVEDAIPSETVPFGCRLTPGAGSCTTFLSMMDTVAAAFNARDDARLSNNELVAHAFEAQGVVMDIHNDIVAVNDALEELDGIRAHMTNEEETEVYTNAQALRDLAIECEQKSFEISLSSRDALTTSITAHDMVSVAADAEKEAEMAEVKLGEEESKASKENRECSECEKLKKDIKRLTQQRKEAAINAGSAAKGCNSKRSEGRSLLQDIHERRMKCRDAREKVLATIAQVRKRSQKLNE